MDRLDETTMTVIGTVIGQLREQVAELTAANGELAMKVSDLQDELSHMFDVIERAKKAPPATTPWFRNDSVYTILDGVNRAVAIRAGDA